MINDIKDLFIYHIQNLYISEEHMLNALPAIIEKAQHTSLKNALNHNAKVTAEQKERLEEIADLINKNQGEKQIELQTGHMSKGMTGLIEEANDLLEKGIAKDVTDAAIIALVQRMQHYAISGYGTALAYANSLHMSKAAELLNETLNEEYDTDELLTALAKAGLNKEATPENKLKTDETSSDKGTSDNDLSESNSQIHITERTINSPGGRAGTSHRGYGSGESRGH